MESLINKEARKKYNGLKRKNNFKVIDDWSRKFLRSRAEYLSEESLKRPLSESEFVRFKRIVAELQKERGLNPFV